MGKQIEYTVWDEFTSFIELDLAEADYTFDLLVVAKTPAGEYYLGTDSGCSCPTPWEWYTELSDFTGPLTAEQAWDEAESLIFDADYNVGENLAELAEWLENN